jgi:hypothetical protein
LNAIIEKMTPEDSYHALMENTGIVPKSKLPDELHNKIVSEGIKGTDNETILNYLSKF